MSGPFNLAELRELVNRQANMIVASGTNELPIKQGDPEYQRVDTKVRAILRQLGLMPPFPWRTLGEWHGYYSQELPTYASRRVHVAQLKNSLLDQLDDLESSTSIHDPGADDSSPTWGGIDKRINGLIAEYDSARDKDTWQDVGRRAREILIDLGKLIADPDLVPAEGAPKGADARAWFDLLLITKAAGKQHAELRAVMAKTWDLAQKVTHGDIDDVDAFAAAQSTVMLVRTTQMLLAG